jgi:hypothetical protein
MVQACVQAKKPQGGKNEEWREFFKTHSNISRKALERVEE